MNLQAKIEIRVEIPNFWVHNNLTHCDLVGGTYSSKFVLSKMKMRKIRFLLFSYFLLAILHFPFILFSQGTWTPKANFGGTTRSAASGFSIGTKGYVTLGEDINGMQTDLWEWDQPTNAWTQKANFPGAARCQAGAFSVGTKGYVGTGFAGNFFDDFYEWDQASNTWTQKATVPGGVRGTPVCFNIGNKGYLGTGYLWGPVANDFYEYDPALNAWTQKANFGGLARYAAAGFAIGTKGYIGTGVNLVQGFPSSTITYLTDFWEWTQATNVWTQKANFPGVGRGETSGFTIGKNGYMGIGTTNIGTGTVSTFYKYNPTTNAWTPIPNFGGGIREMAASFSIGCYGYIATGFINDQQAQYKKDLWEYYDPTDTTCGCSLVASATGNTTICAGQSATISASGGANYFWSNGSNSSSTVVNPGSTTTYSVTVSSGPSCSDVATVTVTVAPAPTAIVNSSQTICAGQAVSLSASGGSNYSWSNGASTSVINVSPTITTNYSVTVSNGPACSSTAFVTITVSPSPPPIVSGTLLICQGDPTTLTASGGGGNYTWNSGSTNAVIVVAPSSSTTYTVVSTNPNGCVASATVSVSVAQPPIATLSGATICEGQSATLTGGGVGNYQWSTGATTNPIAVSPTTTTNYSVVVSAGSCVDTATATVTVLPGASVSISGNTILCVGDIATLTASGGGNYSWSTGATAAVITAIPTVSTIYTVTSANANGCSATATISVTVSPAPIAFASSTTVCAGQNAVLTAMGGATYLWSNGATTYAIAVSASGTYTVVVSIGSCSDTTVATVQIDPSPTALAYSNVNITQGQSTTLGASGGGTYLWSNGATSGEIAVAPVVNTIYCVTVTNSYGCTDTACVLVTVEEMDCSFGTVGELFVPNAFSPNEDGENERLKLLYGNYSCLDTYRFTIYNRWGENVFDTEQPNAEWDGNHRGKPEDSGLFVWYMKAELKSGEKVERKGNISLIR